MLEGLLQPMHLLVSVCVIAVAFGIPIWFVISVVTSLNQIKRSLARIAQSLETRT